jgi:hypothetical protein
VRKIIALTLIVLMMFSLCACGNVSNVKILPFESESYTDAEINDAINVIKSYFRKNFNGCTLTEITYAGDEYSKNHQDFATRNNAEQALVLISSFDTGESGGDGSLNPNDTYGGFLWILVRNSGGKWRHVDHGY